MVAMIFYFISFTLSIIKIVMCISESRNKENGMHLPIATSSYIIIVMINYPTISSEILPVSE